VRVQNQYDKENKPNENHCEDRAYDEERVQQEQSTPGAGHGYPDIRRLS